MNHDPYNAERNWSASVSPEGILSVDLQMSKAALQHWLDNFDKFGALGIQKNFHPNDINHPS